MRSAWTYPVRAESVTAARRDARRVMADLPLAYEVELVVSELATNALRHGARHAEDGEIRLELIFGDDGVEVAVTDPGVLLWSGQAGPPDEASTSGRGLAIVEVLAAKLGHRMADGAQTVWALLPWEAE